MRILMLAQFYAPIVGGEERIVQDLSVELAARGHSVAVATLWHPGLPDYEVQAGVRVYRMRSSLQRLPGLFTTAERRHAPAWPDPEVTLALNQVARQEQPELVHAHNWLVYSYLPLKAARGVPLALTLHDYSLVCPQKRLMRGRAACDGPELRKCLACGAQHYGRLRGLPTVLAHASLRGLEQRLVDLFLPISQAVAERSGLVPGARPYRVIPNFVPDDLAEQRADHPALAGLPAGDHFLFVGDLSLDKGLGVLLEAYQRLVQPWPLVLVGRRCADTPAVFPAGVIALGVLPHPAVMEAWRRSAIALVPSTWAEPFGVVALEAMAAGRPVIASAAGGLTDVVVDEETGLLVPPGDRDALARAMQRLQDNPHLRRRWGLAGRRRLTQFQASQVVPVVEQTYADLVRAFRRAAAKTGQLSATSR